MVSEFIFNNTLHVMEISFQEFFASHGNFVPTILCMTWKFRLRNNLCDMKISFEENFAWRWNFVWEKLCMTWKFCFKNTLDDTEDSGPEAWVRTFPQRRTWGDLVIFDLLRSVLFLNALWLIELPSSYGHRMNWNGKHIQNEFWVARLNKTCDCTTGRRNIPDAKHVHPLSSPF